jgi:trypsin
MNTLVAVLALCLASANAYLPVGPKYVPDNVHARSAPKVVGGTDASATDAPWQISLVSSGWFGDSHICGGSLIGTNTAITAAHCCDGSTASTLKVKYGGLDRTALAITSAVSQVIMHPNWNSATIDSDYCILRLASAVSPGANVQLISVATSRPADGTQALLTGWGKTSGSTSTLPTKLQRVNMAILNQSGCNAKWGDVNPVTSTMICAQNPAASGCNGDSGGPLTVNGQLVGIVSWGANGCPPDTTARPTVYADPITVAPWISSNTQ